VVESVYSAVRAGYLYKVDYASSLQGYSCKSHYSNYFFLFKEVEIKNELKSGYRFYIPVQMYISSQISAHCRLTFGLS